MLQREAEERAAAEAVVARASKDSPIHDKGCQTEITAKKLLRMEKDVRASKDI